MTPFGAWNQTYLDGFYPNLYGLDAKLAAMLAKGYPDQ
jgi:hypothetical protein